MPELVWDRVGDRVYETGLDKGVLYLPDGSAVPWNGLTSVIESFDSSSSPVYFDGMKIQDLVVLGDFSATLKAVTYPDEFLEMEGLASNKVGLFYADQPPQVFGLCYRTRIGNDLEGDEAGYKLHILYNVTAIPRDKAYVTTSDDPSLVEFEWDITAVPEEVENHRPTAHVVIDSRDFDPWLLEDIEAMLYGNSEADASLMPMSELVPFINAWYRLLVVDNGDGTWTATEGRPGFITVDVNGQFQITGANALYLDDETYELSSTTDISEIPQIKIYNNGDGTWNAETEYDGLFIETAPGVFEIRNANVIWIDADTYQISDTTE